MENWITGMDVSTLLEVERLGAKFYDHGTRMDAMDILKGYGMNMVRLRLWNDPFSEDGASYGAGGGEGTCKEYRISDDEERAGGIYGAGAYNHPGRAGRSGERILLLGACVDSGAGQRLGDERIAGIYE